MRSGWCFPAFMLIACVIYGGPRGDARQAADAAPYAGTWSGTWDSDAAGSGKFDLILESAQGGALKGKVVVTSDGGDYNADLRQLEFDGKKMAAKYDFPLDPSAEIVVAADFGDRTAAGTWSLRPKGQSSELAGGKWQVKKK